VADQKKWFKVWTTLLIDSLSTKIDDIGRFAVLGCLIASRGENGKLVTDKKTLQLLLQCKEISPEFTKMFNVIIEDIGETCNGNISVTLKNWHKYQVDTTGYERQQRFREAKTVTGKVTGKVTAQDKIRLDKNIKDSFELFWIEYPNKKAKQKALEIWNKLNPDSLLVGKILEAVKKARQSIEWTKDSGQFIPNPTTYLNQHRWEDEYIHKKAYNEA